VATFKLRPLYWKGKIAQYACARPVNCLDAIEKKIIGRLVQSNPLTSLVAQSLVTVLTELLGDMNNDNTDCFSCS